MSENTTITEQKTQTPNEGVKPWYKKKNTIIAISSILGAGVLATVIAVPIALTSKTTNIASNPIVDPKFEKTIEVLNVANNKNSRMSVWNNYAGILNAPITSGSNDSPISQIVRTN